MDGDEFRQCRRRLGLTQVEAGKQFGVHPITVSRWERDQARIPEAVATLARLLLKMNRAAARKRRR